MNFKNDLPKNELVEKIIDYINKNFTKGINNTHIAKFLGYHPNYLNRIFKENMNISIHHYILNLRIEKAKNMLSETPLSAYEISKKVGFNDYSYFSSYFKQKNRDVA